MIYYTWLDFIDNIWTLNVRAGNILIFIFIMISIYRVSLYQLSSFHNLFQKRVFHLIYRSKKILRYASWYKHKAQFTWQTPPYIIFFCTTSLKGLLCVCASASMPPPPFSYLWFSCAKIQFILAQNMNNMSKNERTTITLELLSCTMSCCMPRHVSKK